MTPYTITKTGSRRQVDSVNGVITYSSTSPVLAGHRSLVVDVASQNHGDHKSPNDFGFIASRDSTLFGTQLAVNMANPSTYSLQQGFNIGSFDIPPIMNLSAAYNKALSKAFDKVRNQLDLSVDAFQIGQNKRMIKAVFTGVNYIRSFSPKRWASKWLEYQYGWHPLLMDIYGIIDNTYKAARNGGMRVDVRASEPSNINRVISPSSFGYGTEHQKYRRNARARIVMDFELHDDVLQAAGDWSSLNPASIAWEILPYSFVVDWFYDIGGYLRNMESAILYRNSFRSGFVTLGTLLDGTTEVKGTLVSGPYRLTVDAIGSYRETRFNRSVLHSIPFPRPPQLKADLGPSRLISGAALLDVHFGLGRNYR